MRVVVLGGAGHFGARICRALSRDSAIDVVATGRREAGSINSPVKSVRMDLFAPDFSAVLGTLQPDVVIHCAGPFQAQDYRVARAAMECGAHYIDLADGRDFVSAFVAHNDAIAAQARRTALTGASTLPALSSAVVDHLVGRLANVQTIAISIAPGQRVPRGTATLTAVLSYAGQGFLWWQSGAWRTAYGWQELKKLRFPFGARWAAACDVPDLALFPERYAGVRTVSFHAALEVALQHHALWCIGGLRRIGIPLRPDRWAKRLGAAAIWLDRLGSDCGGMSVRLVGQDESGGNRTLTWYLVARSGHGPEIPCMASVLLTRKLARGQELPYGAHVCMGFLTLSDFEAEFARWDIETSIEVETH